MHNTIEEHGDKLKESFENAEVATIPNANHWLHADNQ
jgi:hypothetical protein